jgi:tripartite ATP-independent transporter DctM subunit
MFWVNWVAQLIEKVILPVTRVSGGVGAATLAAMMFLTATDVTLRLLFARPIPGSNELTEFMMVLAIFPALAYTGVLKGHIKIELISSRLPQKVQLILGSVTSLIGFCILVLIAWSSAKQGITMLHTDTVTGALKISLFPFYFVAVLGSGLYSVVILEEFLRSLSGVLTCRWRLWEKFLSASILVLLVPIVSLCLHGSPSSAINPVSVGICGVVLLVIGLFSGMPIGLVMGAIGFLGISYLSGFHASLYALGTVPYRTFANYFLSVVPLFVIMGFLASNTGMTRDLYHGVRQWLGHQPGGLAMATIGASGFFAAVSGSSLASAATMGTIALPEMKRYNYDLRLATGSIAAGGTLGILIPPSVILVIYGVLTEQSIGKLFIAGVIPGVILALLFMLTIYLRVRRNPQLGPPGPSTNFKQKLTATRSIFPVMVLFLLVVGGIYLGIFSPTEAAGIGAFGVFLYMLCSRQISWSSFSGAFTEAVRTTAMIFLILTGAMILGYFLALSKLPWALSNFISELPLSRHYVFAGIMVVYIILGCMMDSLAMILLTIPIFFPTVTALGFDPIWFGVMVVIVVEMGVITPPIGLNVFVLAGVDMNVPIYTIFRGVWPFFLAMIALAAILTAFPQIVLFLPNLIR